MFRGPLELSLLDYWPKHVMCIDDFDEGTQQNAMFVTGFTVDDCLLFLMTFYFCVFMI